MTRQLHPNHTAVPKNFCRLPSGYGVVKIGVSGTADLGLAGMDAFEKAKELGREISRQGAIITTGATTGFPMYAAMGAKDECGFSVGLSPASTEREHVESYKLPLDFMDVIIYTGFGYAGRDLMFVRSADAMVIGPGRIGTYNEFSVAFEDRRPIGILEGSWETDEIIKRIVDSANRPNDRLFFESDPKRLVARLIKLVLEEKQETNMVYRNPDGVAGKEAEYIL
ncbi:hypothetical protein FJY94_01060 [Candidatus Kaiserbacteria bacterium]|nr:hypothetical protein [Candidatus Kaiserbacteria bacterium]